MIRPNRPHVDRSRASRKRLRMALDAAGFTKKNQRTAFQEIPIIIDRPKGFVQEGKDPAGKPWRRVYRYDYGFIPKTEGGDLEDVDVFLGPSSSAATSFWAVQTKDDGSFDEFKIFLGFSSFSLARSCYRMHIPAKFCAGFFRVPVAALKSILGLAPQPLLQGLEKNMRNRTMKLAGVSFDTVRDALVAALAAAYPADSAEGACSPCGPYPIDVYDDAVVFSHDGKTWKQPYTFAADVATLGGSPVAVVRTYVPVSDAGAAPGAGEVTMSQKNSVKKAGTASGAGDIVSLASERLAVCAQTLSKGDGTITPEIAAEISAVMALLEVAGSLYTGSTENAPELEDPEGDDTDDGASDGGDLTMADVADAEKRGGTVRMTSKQFIAYASQRLVKVRASAEANPTAAAVKSAQLESMLLNGLASLRKAGEGDDKIDVVVPADDGTPTVETPNEVAGVPNPAPQPPVPAPAPPPPTTPGVAPTTPGAPVSTDKAVAKAAASVAALRARIGGGGPAAVTKSESAPGEALAASAADLFTPAYVEELPDSAFLYVEDGVQVDKSGRSPKAARHFPVRDIGGTASGVMIDRALAALPTWGASAKVKELAIARATSLKTFASDLAKSRAQAAARKDSAEWPADLSAPNDRMRPDSATQTYGFDNLSGKLEGAPAK